MNIEQKILKIINLLRSVIELENSNHPLDQSHGKIRPMAAWSLAFSRALVSLVFTATQRNTAYKNTFRP